MRDLLVMKFGGTSVGSAERIGAAARLAAVCFAPFWSRPAMDEVLALCERAARSVPAHVLCFRPDSSALEALDEACEPRRHADHRG